MANDFSKISDIINESVLSKDAKGAWSGQTFNKSANQAMLFGFWKDVVGKKFEKLSMPYELKGSILFVSAASPAVIQELGFYKNDIIEKYLPYAKGVDLNITDIRFNYKNWMSIKNASPENSSAAFDTDTPVYYTEKDYETIGLDNNEKLEFEKLRETIFNIESMPPHLKEKMFNNALNQYKAKKLRKSP